MCKQEPFLTSFPALMRIYRRCFYFDTISGWVLELRSHLGPPTKVRRALDAEIMKHLRVVPIVRLAFVFEYEGSF
jgi:hypothetical protein